MDQGLGFLDLDRPDILLGDIALAADFRQQPFGIGIALAPDIDAEPDALKLCASRRGEIAPARRTGRVIARGTFAPRLLFARGPLRTGTMPIIRAMLARLARANAVTDAVREAAAG